MMASQNAKLADKRYRVVVKQAFGKAVMTKQNPHDVGFGNMKMLIEEAGTLLSE